MCPDYLAQWNLDRLWGLYLLGVPLEELVWAAATGFAVPIFAGVVLGVRIAPSGQRAKVAVPAASEAVALPADRRADHRQASVGPCVLDSGRGRQRRR